MNVNPTSDTRDAVRCVLLPLDCPREDLVELITGSVDEESFDGSRLYEYTKAAVDQRSISPTQPTGVQHFAELGMFPALATLRVEYADPLAGTEFESREPDGSAERRMATQPFQKHPGLTIYHIRVRDYYLSTMQWLFEQKLPPKLQSEIAAVLLCPDPPPESLESGIGQYNNASPNDLHKRYADRVTVEESHIHLPKKHASRRIQIQPEHTSHVPELYGKVPPITVEQGRVSIPKQLFWIKLAEYGWNAWAKLVNTAFHELSAREIDALVEKTPWLAKIFRGRFKRNNRVFTPYYGVSGVTNPMRDWQSLQDATGTSKIAKLEDKRLITLVDYLQASPIEGFDEEIPFGELFNSLRWYFPAPHRPGNDISTPQTLENALKNASNSNISIFENASGTQVLTMAEPLYTPIHPTDKGKPWRRYQSLLQDQRRHQPELQTASKSRQPSRQRTINPVLPESLQYPGTLYEDSLNNSQSPIASMSKHSRQIHDVEPLVDPESIPGLTRDEIIFLTRVGLAMERCLDDFSLTQSMRPLRFAKDGAPLDIDETKLVQEDWLEVHDEGRAVLYTLHPDRRSALKIPNVSHDGYGEISTAEKSLHRRGVDKTAASLASKPNVTRVIRYYDLWRLTNTSLEERLREADLLSSRIDVIAFDGKTPVCAASVETKSNSPRKSRRSLDKLAAMSEGVETALVTPNSDHLWTVMRLLQDPDYLEFDSFPDSNSEKWDRSNWEEKLVNAGYAGRFFDALETYRSLDDSSLTKDDYRHQIILGNV